MTTKPHKKHLPESINVFGRPVPIIERVITRDLHEDEPCGFYCYSTKRIFVDVRQSYKDKKATLIHEALHALLHRVSINQTKLNSEVEEIIVESISTWLMECDCFELRLKKGKTNGN